MTRKVIPTQSGTQYFQDVPDSGVRRGYGVGDLLWRRLIQISPI